MDGKFLSEHTFSSSSFKIRPLMDGKKCGGKLIEKNGRYLKSDH